MCSNFTLAQVRLCENLAIFTIFCTKIAGVCNLTVEQSRRVLAHGVVP